MSDNGGHVGSNNEDSCSPQPGFYQQQAYGS